MKQSDLFPLLVPRVYLDHPDTPGQASELWRWGIAEQIGPDLYRLLINASDGLIRNVHAEQLEPLGLTVEQAQAAALDNLRQLMRSGQHIEMREVKAANGRRYCIWMGHWLTASCALLPKLHQWASERLQSDRVLVSIPVREFLFLFEPGDRAFRNEMRSFIARAVDGMDKGITSDLFELTGDGLKPYAEADL
jgi:hypothetical protein